MEYRERYLAEAATALSAWADANSVSSYAGYYIDHPAGGKLRAGFTTGQTQNLDDLKHAAVISASGRIEPFKTQPTHSLSYLNGLQANIAPSSNWHSAIFGLVTQLG